jgi:cytochrome P450
MTSAPFHPFSLEYTADPRPIFEAAHRDRALTHHEEFGAWFAHGYEEVRAFCDHPRMARRLGTIPAYAEGEAERLARWPITESSLIARSDDLSEKQTVMRKLLSSHVRPRAIGRMRSMVREVVSQHCAPLRSERRLDVVELVQQVPLTTISRLIGIDEAGPDAQLFLTSAPDFFRGMSLLAPDETRDRAEIAARQMFEALGNVVEDRRTHPREDLISQALAMANELDGVTPAEVVQALVVLVAAGTDTTRLSSSLAIKTLLGFPEQLEALRADRTLVPNAIMELLRYESPTKFLSRVTTEDVDWGEQTIPAGSIVLLSIFGAGWDPEAFSRPEAFDLRRDLRRSLSFGFGAGYCLGVHLARMQLGEIISYFLDHMPEAATLDAGGIRWDPRNLLLREVTCMPIRVH